MAVPSRAAVAGRLIQTTTSVRAIIATGGAGTGAVPISFEGEAMSPIDANEDTTIYRVVVNDEEQYSILANYRDPIDGWRDVGKTGTKDACLAYINEVWTDMTPLSLRKKMAELAKNPPAPAPPEPELPPEKTLVERLAEGEHAVEVGLRPDKTLQLFKEAIDRDYVHIKFTQTRGGTELGMRLDRSASRFDDADFVGGAGTAHVEGELTLDYVKVRCVADIDLATLEGRGHLVPLEPIV
jgi:uncharacterized protein YbdZ (MbtH family)